MKSYSHTPLIEARAPLGLPVWFKMDCYQPTGSFKIRGMDHLVAHHIAEGRKQFVASSGGNAGFSLAYAARLRGGEVTVVVPETTPRRMQDMIIQQGARVLVHGPTWNEADEMARKISNDEGAVYASPFDDPLLWQGHSSLIDEIVIDLEARGQSFPDRLVVAVGGGGLLSGIMEGLGRHGMLYDVEVWAAETIGAGSFKASQEAFELVSIDKIDTVATSLGAKRICDEAWNWHLESGGIKSFTTSDEGAVKACRQFAEEYGVVVEPACGAALASVMPKLWSEGNTLVIVCGGVSWTMQDLENFG